MSNLPLTRHKRIQAYDQLRQFLERKWAPIRAKREPEFFTEFLFRLCEYATAIADDRIAHAKNVEDSPPAVDLGDLLREQMKPTKYPPENLPRPHFLLGINRELRRRILKLEQQLAEHRKLVSHMSEEINQMSLERNKCDAQIRDLRAILGEGICK
jgi:hypothetical protein